MRLIIVRVTLLLAINKLDKLMVITASIFVDAMFLFRQSIGHF